MSGNNWMPYDPPGSSGGTDNPMPALVPLDTLDPAGAAPNQVIGYNGTAVGWMDQSGEGGASTVPVTVIAASGASQALTFASDGTNKCYDITLTANCALTISGGVSGKYQTVSLILRQGGSAGFVPTLPANAKWPGGQTPTPNTQAGKFDLFIFSTPDACVTLAGDY